MLHYDKDTYPSGGNTVVLGLGGTPTSDSQSDVGTISNAPLMASAVPVPNNVVSYRGHRNSTPICIVFSPYGVIQNGWEGHGITLDRLFGQNASASTMISVMRISQTASKSLLT